MQTPSILITGGSSGIGYELSKRFAQASYHLLWVALNEAEIANAKQQMQSEFPQVKIDTLTLDLSQPAAAQQTFDWVQSNGWQIDVLVNNAGFGTHGWEVEIPMEKEVQMIELHVLTLYKLTRFFLTDMYERDAGTIINMSSISSLNPIPKMAVYASTKAFVTHYGKSLNMELKKQGSKVRVMTICPAPIHDTAFKTSAKMENVRYWNGLAATTKAEVADDIWRAFKGGKDVVLSGWKYRWLHFFSKLLPQFVTRKLIWWEVAER
ncbi:MAG: SDR family NAD(P)-dependent oxidoreductase [Saprospiraceae bacterium]